MPGPIGVVIFRPTGTTNRFKTISVTSITVVAGTSTTDVSIPVLAGDFIGFAHNSGASIPNFGGTGGDGFFQLMNYPALNAEYTFAYVAGAWVAGTFLIEAGRFTTSEQVEVIAQSVAQTALNKQYIEITATRNAADFNSIRGIVAGITDASENKVYVINVPNGRWFECDLNGKKKCNHKRARQRRNYHLLRWAFNEGSACRLLMGLFRSNTCEYSTRPKAYRFHDD